MKIPDAKADVDKEREKLDRLPAWQLDKVKSNKEAKVAHILSSQECGVRTEVLNIRRPSRAPR